MTRDEIVTALRRCKLHDSCGPCPAKLPYGGCMTPLHYAAANLIENQHRHIKALMQANAALRDTVLRRDAQIADMSEGLAQFSKAVAVKEDQT